MGFPLPLPFFHPPQKRHLTLRCETEPKFDPSEGFGFFNEHMWRDNHVGIQLKTKVCVVGPAKGKKKKLKETKDQKNGKEGVAVRSR